MVSIPIKNNMKKKRIPHKCPNGNNVIAAGYVMNTKAGPASTTSSTETPVLTDMNPITENTAKPAKIPAAKFSDDKTKVSLKLLQKKKIK